MPTTPDDPAAPRRRLGRGGAAAPAPPAVAWEPAPVLEPAQVDQPEPEFAPGVTPGTVPEPDPVTVPAGGAGAPPEVDLSPEPEPEPEVGAEVEADTTVVVEPSALPEVTPEAEAEAEAVPEATPDAVPQEPSPAPAGPDAPPAAVAGGEGEGESADGGNRFTVRLANFEGPFDLLLQLISKHKLDVTEVALSKVTNEFMAHIHAMGPDWDLDQTTEFLVVAATLLDLKAARLLPAAEVEDEGDLALLEARDLLFARLLQYRAYKQIAGIFAERLEIEALRYPRTVGLEPQHAELLPEVVLSIGPERFAQLAVKAMQPRPKPQVYVDHIHAPLVSVREQAEHVIAMLRERGAASFGELTADAADTLTVVARFLALLELYREKAVALDQEEALGALQVRWTGNAQEGDQPLVTDEFDRETPADPDKRRPASGGADPSEPGPAAGEGESP